jgi:glutamate-1-semialdehyde 2,1-aminomutase
MVKRGVLMAGYHALCYAHTDKEVDRALEAYEDSLQLLKKILDRNEALEAHLEGPVVRPVFQRVADFMSFTTKKAEEA